MVTYRNFFATILSGALLVSTFPMEGWSALSAPQAGEQTPPAQSSAPSDQDLEQMVAPIALYPDALIAQILAAATYPTQVVEADRWVQQNKGMSADQVAAAVDKQSWDPSVKALTQFPSVLDNMSQNLSWTSSLGDVYYNDQQRVMNTVQVMRQKAQQAGNLKSTPQQTVSTQGQTIVIQPASPQVVYVPTYSPAVVYGYPVPAYPGYSGWDVAAAAMISFGVGMAVGAAIRGPSYGWGWGAWGCNWHGGTVVYNRNVYVSRSTTFVNRSNYYNRTNVNVNNINRNNINTNNINRNNVNRNNVNTNNINRNNLNQNNVNRNNLNQNNVNRNNANRNTANTNQLNANRANANRTATANNAANRGYGHASPATTGTRSNAFGGYNSGGTARAESARGQSSFKGGGGGARAGGGRRN
ncbi:MAG TPA: DUF3300 domain-containing protein [Terriglobia bacterium]